MFFSVKHEQRELKSLVLKLSLLQKISPLKVFFCFFYFFRYIPIEVTSNNNKFIQTCAELDGVNITHAEAIWILSTLSTSIIVN